MCTCTGSFRIIRLSRSLVTSSSNTLKNLNTLEFNNEYDSAQTKKILNVVNKMSLVELSKFNISQQRIKKIQSRKEKHGEIKSVEEILELDGFGVKVLEKFCESILTDEATKSVIKKPAVNASYFTSPVFIARHAIESCVSFHVDVNYISWAKLSFRSSEMSSAYVDEWACHEIGNDDKKLSLSDLIQVLVIMNQKIPKADVYVVESQPTQKQSSQAVNSIQMRFNVQKSQVLAMLSVLMAAREKTITKETNENVFFLKNYLSSRLYKTFVGSERVSTESVIKHIFRCNEGIESPKDASYNAIEVSEILRQQYKDTPKIDREFIGKATLNGLTFFKLCITRCSSCTAMLTKRNDEFE